MEDLVSFNATIPDRVVALQYYSGPILALDIWFSAAFASFILCSALTLATYWIGEPWLFRIFIVCACMGVVYGAADIAEDLTLRSIFDHALQILTARDEQPSTHAGNWRWRTPRRSTPPTP